MVPDVIEFGGTRVWMLEPSLGHLQGRNLVSSAIADAVLGVSRV